MGLFGPILGGLDFHGNFGPNQRALRLDMGLFGPTLEANSLNLAILLLFGDLEPGLGLFWAYFGYLEPGFGPFWVCISYSEPTYRSILVFEVWVWPSLSLFGSFGFNLNLFVPISGLFRGL